MSAPERTTHQSILAALRAHSGIKWELDRLEKAADQQIRRTLPKFHYNGEVGLTLLEDLAAVVSSKDWRPPLERSNHQLRDAARHIRKAVRSALRAANGCPTYATISSIVWESTSEAGAERRSIAALPAEDRLFGRGGAIELLRERERRTVVDPETTAPGFLKAMWGYAARCDHEADRIDNILKARNRHLAGSVLYSRSFKMCRHLLASRIMPASPDFWPTHMRSVAARSNTALRRSARFGNTISPRFASPNHCSLR